MREHGKPPKVVVVGSLNMDLVVRVPRRPLPGETITGNSFGTFLGGKGYNQALGAARAGSRVSMVGKVGQDMYGDQFIEALKENGLEHHHVTRAAAGTGIANIVVEPDGTNSIVIIPGANGELRAADIEAAEGVFKEAKVLLLQLETPLESVIAAARLARMHGIKVLLTPAPVPSEPLPMELLTLVDILIPNEIEVFQLAGMEPKTGKDEDLPEAEAAQKLLEQGPQAVLVTLGGRGAAYFSYEGGQEVFQFSPGFEVEVVDTTAAGDAFTGALATALGQDLPVEEAIRHANAGGALACTKPGSGESLPSDTEIKAFLASNLW
ncbi:MAG TPA: ribokinase [Chloroflexia bacterium]|nr:ribokinase [Chloroflexia bacterium]